MADAAQEPSGRVSPFWRTHYPRLWATIRFARALWKLLWNGLTPDESKSDAALETFAKELVYLANALPENSQGKHGTRLHLLRSLFSSYASGTIAAAPETVLLGRADEGGLEQIIDLSEQAVRSYESGLDEDRRTFKKRRGWTVRLRERELCARQAILHSNLAIAYLQFFRGDFSQNLEKALSEYETALSILKDYGEDLHEVRGNIYASLGMLLLNYPTEARRAYTTRAFEVLTRAATDLSSLSPVIKKLMEMKPEFGRGTPFWRFLLIGIPKALPVLVPALWNAAWRGVPTRALWPIIIENVPGKVYWSLGIACEKLGELEKARRYFDAALDLFPYGSFEHAAILVNKGMLHIAEKNGVDFQKVHLAQECFRQAHAESESEVIFAISYAWLARTWLRPDFWARTKWARGKPEQRDKQLAAMVTTLRDVANIARTRQRYALAQDALVSLGKVYMFREDFHRAYQSLALAFRIAERVQRFARSSRLKGFLAGARSDTYDFILRAALEYLSCGTERNSTRLDRISRTAFHIAECGRTRFLQGELASCDLLPRGASSEELRDFFSLRRALLEVELQVIEQEAAAEHIVPDSENTALGVRRSLEDRYLSELRDIREKFHDPAYDPDAPVSPARFAEVRSMLEELSRSGDRALVEYHITDRKLVAFVVLPRQTAPVFLDTGITRDELDELSKHWLDGQGRLQAERARPHPMHWERGYLLQTLRRMQRAAEAPAAVIRKWEEETGRRIARLILIPHRFLHLVPLHAVPLQDGRLWGDAVPIQYAPSASTLFRLFSKSEKAMLARTGKAAIAVAYSAPDGTPETPPLVFHTQEARAVAKAIGGRVLEGSEATASRVSAAIADATYIHFACHGAADPDNPLNGGLDLAPADGSGTARLNLGQLFSSIHLPQGALVVLSACETGIPKIESADEYIGLPAGFLFAGARTVVSTLWPISDLATWLLMREFANGVAAGGDAISTLRSAQQYVRQLRLDTVVQEIRKAATSETDNRCRKQMLSESEWLEHAEPHPFANPYWWAGFTVNGLEDLQIDSAHASDLNRTAEWLEKVV
jgi:CHAT domain-containing protein/tetratricopeptide (TPR) repeat protein